MIEGRYYNGRRATSKEVEFLLRAIEEIEFDVFIEDGILKIEILGEDNVYHVIGQCDFRRMIDHTSERFGANDQDMEQLALAGLLSKCSEIALSRTAPYPRDQEDTVFISSGRLFAGQNSENPPEPENG